MAEENLGISQLYARHIIPQLTYFNKPKAKLIKQLPLEPRSKSGPLLPLLFLTVKLWKSNWNIILKY